MPLGSAERLRGTNVTPFYVDSGALNALHDALPNNEQVSELVKRLLRDESPQDSSGIFFHDAIATRPFIPEPDEEEIWWYTESPVQVTIADTLGNLNGLDAEGNLQRGIPLSSFFLFTTNEGGVLLGGQDYFFTITAQEAGEFSFVLRTMAGANTSAGTLRYDAVAVTAQSRATLALLANDPAPVLELDADGDGSVDTTISPVVIPALAGDFDGHRIDLIDQACAAIGRDPATLGRSYLMFDPASRASGGKITYYESADLFVDMVSRVVELGITGIGLYFPTQAEQRPMFEKIAGEVIPELKRTLG